MIIEDGKFYFIKDELLRVVRLAEEGINIPFYNVVEMKESLLKELN